MKEKMCSWGTSFCVDMMDIKKGSAEKIGQWLALAEKGKDGFPGLETEEGLRQFRDSVLAHMERGAALEAREAGRLAGVLLFDREGRTLDFLAVEREHRRKGIGRALCLKALEEMPEGDIAVITHPPEAERGHAARAFYRSLDFEEEERIEIFGAPAQVFRLRR